MNCMEGSWGVNEHNKFKKKKQTIGIKCSVLYQYLNQKYIDRKTGELSDGIYLLAMYLRKIKIKSRMCTATLLEVGIIYLLF